MRNNWHRGSVKLSMARVLLLISAILLSGPAAHSAEPSSWGGTVKGLRMALSYISAEGIVEITIENTTTKGLLLPLGQLGARDPFSLIATWGDNREFAIFTGGPSASAGRFYPFVVPLLPGSRYVVRRASFQYRLASKDESLGKALLRHPALRVELVTESAPLSIDCFPVSSFWTGTLISNTVRVE